MSLIVVEAIRGQCAEFTPSPSPGSIHNNGDLRNLGLIPPPPLTGSIHVMGRIQPQGPFITWAEFTPPPPPPYEPWPIHNTGIQNNVCGKSRCCYADADGSFIVAIN